MKIPMKKGRKKLSTQKSSSPLKSPSASRSSNAERKRNSNFSRDEVRCLVIEYKRKSKILNFGTREQMQKCWEDITAAINDVHPEFCRSVNEVKKKWVGLLHDTKKQYYTALSEAEKRRDGKRRRLSEIAEMIIKLKGGFSDKNVTSDEIKMSNVSTVGENESKGHSTTFYIPSINNCDDSDENDDDIFALDTKDGLTMPVDSIIDTVMRSFDHNTRDSERYSPNCSARENGPAVNEYPGRDNERRSIEYSGKDNGQRIEYTGRDNGHHYTGRDNGQRSTEYAGRDNGQRSIEYAGKDNEYAGKHNGRCVEYAGRENGHRIEYSGKDIGQHPVEYIDKESGSSLSTSFCGCGLQKELVALKRESLALKKRKLDIMDEHRLDAKKLYWEQTKFWELKKQKLELEINNLQANLSSGVFKPIDATLYK